MNCLDSVFITAVSSGEQLAAQGSQEPGDHRPLYQRPSTATTAGLRSGSSAMATPPAAASTTTSAQEEGRQSPAVAASPRKRSALSPDAVVVNVAGTRYAVGRSILL